MFLYLLQGPHVKLVSGHSRIPSGSGVVTWHGKSLTWSIHSGNMKEGRMGKSSNGKLELFAFD